MIPLGSKACGGPWSYAVASEQSETYSDLLAVSEELERIERIYNLAADVTSYSAYEIEPSLACAQSRRSRAGYPRGFKPVSRHWREGARGSRGQNTLRPSRLSYVFWGMEKVNAPWAQKLLSFWFGPLTNETKLDRSVEPFQTQMRRWYGKDTEVDHLIRELFEPALLSVTGSAENWNRAEQAAAGDARAQLALTVLIDQLPRNMYRDTPRMYEHDALALAHAYRSLPDALSSDLTLVERMFAIVPLMHAEDLTIQQVMVECFVELLLDAEQVSPHNLNFFQFALDYARRHREIIQRFGRFPHRNSILNRRNTPEEDTALRTESLAF